MRVRVGCRTIQASTALCDVNLFSLPKTIKESHTTAAVKHLQND
jgi:hypothetical protein